ncbi:unnamed protein product [Fraxinus pennsylvanica]|uniref:Uncharacterized protein n=1 Tax=Fraxinus pennsylvanica TaxID=56036 RepID=A0AAD2DM95_9LAMI|nr:unnamed protein product [Fraxinus pennsylvanica]
MMLTGNRRKTVKESSCVGNRKPRCAVDDLSGSVLGGFTALVSAAALKDQVKGVVLLHSVGKFGDANSGTNDSEETALRIFMVKPLKEIFQRVVLGFLFWQAMELVVVCIWLFRWLVFDITTVILPKMEKLRVESEFLWVEMLVSCSSAAALLLVVEVVVEVMESPSATVMIGVIPIVRW